MSNHPSHLLPNLWDAAQAPTDALGELVYVSNLLGSDPRITNFGGGNTSTKVSATDPLTGEAVEVLWVKASGGDLGSATGKNFASLYQQKVLGLEGRYQNGRKGNGDLPEDAIVPLYAHCVFDGNLAAPSIDTPLHSFVPYAAVSHMHSDAVIAIAASKDVRKLTEEVFEGKMGFLPWMRPGLELGLMLRDLIEENPGINSAMMASHGFICWADTWQECYQLTLDLINQAADYIERKKGSVHAFGPVVSARQDNGKDALVGLLPLLRGKVAHEGQRLIASVDTSEAVLEFLEREKASRLTNLGTSCPDHFLRTKIRPLVLPADADEATLDRLLAEFRANYASYYDRCKHSDSPAMRNPNPSVVLVPGVGMVAFNKNAQEAKVTGEFYRNAIEVMKGAETVSEYVALDEQEAFNIEYWLLEEAKLKRQPPEKELSRQVAVVTGGASGIGRATALKLAAAGAHVVLFDIDEAKLSEAAAEVEKATGVKGGAKGIRCDITDRESLQAAFDQAVLAFGGVDILVVNAGSARRGSVTETSDEEYDHLDRILIRGAFESLAVGIRLLKDQGTGGSVVIIGSKNGTAAASQAALYSGAKAFQLHIGRCCAVDYAPDGIRVNSVNPDGVVVGSGIWSQEWKAQTAAQLGIDPEDLVEHYRQRNLLKVIVTPEDVAEAVLFLASEKRSSRTTGCTISVDGGNREGFLR